MFQLVTAKFLEAWGELQVKLVVGKLVTSNSNCVYLIYANEIVLLMKRELLQRTNE